MTPNPPSPGGAARHSRRNARRRWSVLISSLMLAGPALAAHGLLAGQGISLPLVAGTFLVIMAPVLNRVRARHDPETIRIMERRNEEAFATYWT